MIVLGMLTSLSLPPFNYFIINFFTFSIFFFFLIRRAKTIKNNKIFFFYGWLFGFGYFGSNLYWISISLTFDQSFKFLIPFAMLLIPSFLALFYGSISYLFIIFRSKKIVNSFLLFSVIFGLVEFVRSFILTGFPWNLIAYSFSNQLELLSITSVIGTYGFNILCISLFTIPSLLILKESKKDLIICIFFLMTFFFCYFYGSLKENKFYKADKEIYDYKIRVIGSNISLDRFYTNVDPVSIIEEMINISRPNTNEKTIFVWPEGILPGISPDRLNEYNWLFKENFNENHLFIIGVNNHSTDNGSKKYFNSLFVYDNNLNILNSYNKINLVPFGEFLPFENILSIIGLRSLTNNYQSFSSGNKRDIIEIEKKFFSLKILPLICYEIIYSGKLFKNTNFDLIVNISEDGWFGKSIGPKQHLSHSIFRAVESGKYVVRSANNGVAAIINPIGNIEKKVNLGLSGYIELTENRKIQPTIFSKYGNKIFGLVILLYIFLIFSFNKIKNE